MESDYRKRILQGWHYRALGNRNSEHHGLVHGEWQPYPHLARAGRFGICDLFTGRIASYPESRHQVTPEVTPEVKRMLSVLSREMKRGEIMTKLGLKDEKHFREHYQQVAVKLGLIEMTIPEKPRSSKQKYRLTDKGRDTLEVLRNEEDGE